MNGKKFTTLCGVLMVPLRIGCRAFIFHEGGYIRTSTVVAIHSVEPGAIHFETRNTHYRLLPAPLSQTADCRPVMNMVA